MTSNLKLIAAAATICLLAGCTKVPGMPGFPGVQGGGSGSETTSTAAYDAVMVAGSAQVMSGVVRLNVSTGQTVTAFGAPSQMVTINDPPIPVGQYHLLQWTQPAASDGTIQWGVARVDKVSGRIWILNGGGSNPFTWVELTPPAK